MMEGTMYYAAGFRLATEVPFPELPVTEGPSDLRLTMVAALPEVAGEEEYRVLYNDDGSVWCRFLSSAGAYRVAFGVGLDFRILVEESAVLCAVREEGVGDETLRHLFLHHIVPYVASLRGQFMLHACGVEVGGRAVAFAGESGAGKSTTALAFGQRGYRLLSDDILPVLERVGGHVALPSLPYVRVREDSVNELGIDRGRVSTARDFMDKSRVHDAARFVRAMEEIPLGAVYYLNRDDVQSIEIERLPAAEAFFRLVRTTVLLEMKSRAMLTTYFDRLNGLVERVPVFELRFPREYASLPLVIERIERHQEEIYGTE